jgi:AraC family transcriptional regulator of adaptative response / DNA-3-methyladenine glycosylase II
MEAPTLDLDRRALDRARRSRDARFDGRFFIAVTSTGIYCRPVCPAPSPKNANVRYYPSAAAAAEAGFRPCLRCRPEAAPGTPAWLGTSATVNRALKLIHAGALDHASVDELAARLGIGPRHLHRLFVRHVGAAPLAVAQTRRLHFAKRLIDETELTMTQVALAAGFGSLRRFNAAFRGTYGRAPSSLRRGKRPAADAALRLTLAYRPPYAWDEMLEFLAARAVPGMELVEDGAYHRTLFANGVPGTLRVAHRPALRALELEIHHPDPLATAAIVQRVRAQFDLAADPQEIVRTLGSDPVLGRSLAAHPGLRLPGAHDPFELAVRAVLGQQVSVAAARTLAGRLVARCGASLPEPLGALRHAFPDAARLARADLAGLGLTGARSAALRALATAVRDGAVDFDAEPATLRAALAALPGFGPWTVEYVMLRAAGDPDAFPADDLGLRKALAGRGARPTGRALAARAEAWRPWRGYAVFHLWKLLEAPPRAGAKGGAPRRTRRTR